MENKETTAVRVEYEARLLHLHKDLTYMQSRQLRILLISVVCAVLVLALCCASRNRIKRPLAFALIPTAGIFLIRGYLTVRRRSHELARRSTFYERGLQRLDGTWRGNGIDGREFARPNHLYQDDLNILGEGSLFELLCTTRSEAGAERLATYLLDPVGLEEMSARQEAIKELRNATALREEIALLGDYQFQQCRSSVLIDEVDATNGTNAKSGRNFNGHPALSILLLFSGSACLLLGALILIKAFIWSTVLPWLLPPVIFQVVIGAAFCRSVRPSLKRYSNLANHFVVLRQGLALIERQHFYSAKLNRIVETVRRHTAGRHVHDLERLVYWIGQREKPEFYLLSLLLAAGTQIIFATERWLMKHGQDFKGWVDAWAEFESLNALACYAHEHPENIFPELLRGETTFVAKELGHPLLPEKTCIGNSILLDQTLRFYIISGSNMAGKSTLLRSIGINAVLAYAGASIPATSARLSPLTICASIAITDSILDGKSKFMAEIARLQKSLHCMLGERPVLFLIDEMLSGTNSRDRRTVAESIIKTFIAGGAIGALSTHDEALTEIGSMDELRGINVHMGSKSPDAPLCFDYKIKAGASQISNALAITKMIGITS